MGELQSEKRRISLSWKRHRPEAELDGLEPGIWVSHIPDGASQDYWIGWMVVLLVFVKLRAGDRSKREMCAYV